MSLRTKIILGYFSVIFITIILSVVVIQNYVRVTDLYEKVSTKYIRVTNVAHELAHRMMQRQSGLQGFLLTGKTRYLIAYDENVLPIKELIREATELNGDNPTYGAILKEYERLLKEWEEGIGEVQKQRRHLLDFGDISYEQYVTSIADIDKKGRSILRQMKATENQLIGEVERERAAKSALARQVGNSTKHWLLMTAIGAVSISLLLGVALSTRLTAGLDKVAQAAHGISIGDFSYRLPVRKSRDELATLARAFNEMARKLETNIRAVRESEQKYAALVENANDGIAIIQDDHYVFTNKAFSDLTGFTNDELAGMHHLSLIVPESREMARERYEERLRGTDVQWIAGVKVLTKDERVKHLEINAGLIEFRNKKAVLMIYRDVTERKRYEETLKELSEQMITTQEEERKRISRELHDEIGQALTAININMELLGQGNETADGKRRRIEDTRRLIEKSMDDIHRISYDLRPYLLDSFGLHSAVRWYVDTFRQRTGIDVRFEPADDALSISPPLETLIYRVVQETLTNIAKHSGARTASVSIRRSNRSVELEVRDDGKGFSPDSLEAPGRGRGGLGLFGMRERARFAGGRFSIHSEPGKGTSVSLSLPVLMDAVST